MSKKFICITLSCILTLTARLAIATPITYTVDPAQSALTISGLWGSQPIVSQYNVANPGTNGLITSYQGVLYADLTNNSIQIMGGTIGAEASSSYQPIFGPADYGVANSLIDPLLGAVRNFAFSLNSSVIEQSGVFDSGLIAAVIEAGQIDYAEIDYSSIPMTETGNSVPISGNLVLANGESSLTDDDGLESLTIPINTNFTVEADDEPLTIDLSGQIIATAELPEPNYIPLLIVFTFGFCRRFAAPR